MAVSTAAPAISKDEEEQNRDQQYMEAEMLSNIYSGEMMVLKEGLEYTVSFLRCFFNFYFSRSVLQN